MEGSADPQKNLDGKEHAELDFAPYMSFLPDVLPQRYRTTSNAISDELSSDESLVSSTISYIERGEEPSPAMAMCRMLGKFLQHQQNNPVSRPRPILAYWISELNSMRPEDAAKVEKKMTMLLWDEKEALNY